MFRITIRRLLVLMTLVGFLLSIFVTKSHLRAVAFFISNDDVVYEAEAKSIRLTGATRFLCLFGDQSHPIFLRCLDDPDAYAAAHFALAILIEGDRGRLALYTQNRFCHSTITGTIVESTRLDFNPKSHQRTRLQWLRGLTTQGRYDSERLKWRLRSGNFYVDIFGPIGIEKEFGSEDSEKETITAD